MWPSWPKTSPASDTTLTNWTSCRKPRPPTTTDLRIDEQQLTMENEFVKVTLSPQFGAIISLIDKRNGREMLNQEKGAFPSFHRDAQSGL